MVNMVSEDASVTDILAKLLPKLKDIWETRKTSSCQCVSTVSTLQPHLWSFLKAVWGLHRNDPTLCSVSPGPFATSPLQFLSFGHTQPKQTSKRTHNTKKSGPKSLHLLPPGFWWDYTGTQKETLQRCAWRNCQIWCPGVKQFTLCAGSGVPAHGHCIFQESNLATKRCTVVFFWRNAAIRFTKCTMLSHCSTPLKRHQWLLLKR
jgi:hypothetical protein